MTVRIINADVMDGLRSLPDETVQCVVTSPPYWGLRDYGVDGQIGLEPTFQDFIGRLVMVFEEVRRVLRKDGVCFVNMGDSYASTPSGAMKSSGLEGGVATQQAFRLATSHKLIPQGLKPKDLIGQPWRLAFALQDAGWWLRQDIIWHKPNPMPESVTDRCTKSHEYIFLLVKSERYFWDAEAIKEASSPDSHARAARGRSNDHKYADGGPGNQTIAKKSPVAGTYRAAGVNPKAAAAEMEGPRSKQNASFAAACVDLVPFRNKRSVWTIGTNPFPDAHFATFPPELPEICIKAGSRPGDTVLDPFSGAGTTALVADRLQRHAIGIELNPEYAAMSERRINRDRGGLLDIMEAQS
jgi:DNA modification methylase